MENPALDISHVITRLLSPSTPTSQILTIQKYFTSTASFAHPLCYIESSADSRARIIRLFAFLHLVAPTCTAKIRRQSFNDAKGRMSVEMEICPVLRGVERLGRVGGRVVERMGARGLVDRLGGEGMGTAMGKGKAPTIPVHVFLSLGRVENGGLSGPWRIWRVEVVFQPMDVLHALHLEWIGRVLYFFLWMFVMAVVMMGQMGRAWNQKDFSIYQETTALAVDGYQTLVVPPRNALVWSYGRAKDTAAWSYDRAKSTAWDQYRWARATAKVRLMELHRRHEPRVAVVKQAVRVSLGRFLRRL